MFQKATKQASRLRLALTGVSGSGKTFTALSIASHLGKRVAVIDTEHGSAAKYSDIFEFDVLNLDTFEAEKFTTAIKAAVAAGYDVIVIDSLSHAWMGTGGTLDSVTEAKRRSKNEFTAWTEPSKHHTELIEAILHARANIITTMRSKMEYVLEESQGKKVPRKVGMAPVQRDGMEYEFDVVGDMQEATLVVTKTRCAALAGKSFHHPGAEFAGILGEWLTGAPAPVAPTGPSAEARDAFAAVCAELVVAPRAASEEMIAHFKLPNWAHATDAHLVEFAELMRQEAEAPEVVLTAPVAPAPVTSQHPIWGQLIETAKSKGLNYTTVCQQLMQDCDALDVAAVPIERVQERIAELSAQQVAV